jgi:O-acetyl-ADP-ribose deacetylase (regulator of RNase III)
MGLAAPGRRTVQQPRSRWTTPAGLEVSLFVGELADAPTRVLCTSTNPRLSMLGGTGSAVVERAGWGVHKEAQAVVQRAAAGSGRTGVAIGTVHRTSAGRLPHAFLLHCVVSGPGRAASAEAIRSCVQGALMETERAGCPSLAMPVFGSGHASFPYERAITAMAEALLAYTLPVPRVVVVVFDPDRLPPVERVLDGVLRRSAAPAR